MTDAKEIEELERTLSVVFDNHINRPGAASIIAEMLLALGYRKVEPGHVVVPSPEWGPDEYGRENQALRLGNLYVGNVDDYCRRDEPSMPWRAWAMLDSDNTQIGKQYATKDEARGVVEKAVAEAMLSASHSIPKEG